MAIAIHPTHRRLAELFRRVKESGGLEKADRSLLREIGCMMEWNFEFVHEVDGLKNTAMLAYELGDVEWHNEACAALEQLEEKIS